MALAASFSRRGQTSRPPVKIAGPYSTPDLNAKLEYDFDPVASAYRISLSNVFSGGPGWGALEPLTGVWAPGSLCGQGAFYGAMAAVPSVPAGGGSLPITAFIIGESNTLAAPTGLLYAEGVYDCRSIKELVKVTAASVNSYGNAQINQYARDRLSAISEILQYVMSAQRSCEENYTPVSPDTGRVALEILQSIQRPIRIPQISPSSDGEIVLNWVNGSCRFEAIIDKDLHLVWILDKDDADIVPGEDLDLTKNSIANFLDALRNFYE